MAGLAVTPPKVELKDVVKEEKRNLLIIVKNSGTKTTQLRLRPPKSKYFSVRGWQPSQFLAPGLETSFEVLFDAHGLEQVKEVIQDRLLIQSESGDYELSLKALLPRSEVMMTGDLNFGLVPVESKATKRFKLSNLGAAPCPFKLEYDRSSGLTLEPASGEVPPSMGEFEGSITITGVLSVESVGALAGEVSVLLQGSDDPARKLSYSATGVKHTFNLVENGGVIVNEVDFGPRYFGEELVRTVQLFNNGPVEGKFMITYGTPIEIKARIEEAEGSGMGGDADDPYAGFMQAARQKTRSRQIKDNPFSVSPAMGILQPYGRTNILIRYKPEDVSTLPGFTTALPRSDDTLRTYDFMALIELAGMSMRLKVPIRGKAMAPGLRLTPPVLEFGDVLSNAYADQLVMAVNTNSLLGLKFKVEKPSPYFDVQPSSGTILGEQDKQLVVRYHPKALGHHSAVIPVKVFSLEGKQIQEAFIRLNGSSLRVGSKDPLVGGTDKLPEAFKKPAKFLDEEQIFLSKLDAQKKSTRRGLQLWEKPEHADTLADVGPKGTQNAMSREELIAVTQHKEKYAAVISSKRAAKTNLHLTKRVDEDDVNLGMDTRSGLRPHEPHLPREVDPLWTVGNPDEGKPMQQRSVLDRELEGLLPYPDRPQNDFERIRCERELSKEELGKLVVGPKVLDFGTVSVGSSVDRSVLFNNPLDTFLHVVFDVQNPPELKRSPSSSQVIPPGGKARFPLLFHAAEVRYINHRIEYCINSCHVLSLGLTADVVPVSLELSADDLHFEFSADNWEGFVDKMLILENTNKFPVEYTLDCSGGTFSVNPKMGTVKPLSSSEVVVRWAPPLDGSASGALQGSLTLNLIGSQTPKTVLLQGQLPEGKLNFREKEVDVGMVPCGVLQSVSVQIKNGGTSESAFKILPHPLLQVSPTKGKLSADNVMELVLTYNCSQPGAVTTVLEVEVQGNKPLKLPFKAVGVVPVVEIKEDEFNFPPSFIGSRIKLPFTLMNNSAVPAQASINLTAHSYVQLSISKDVWSTEEYEVCPLQRIGAKNDRICSQNSSRSISRRQSSMGGAVFDGDGSVFHININAGAQLPLEIVFSPSAVLKETFELSCQTICNGAVKLPPERKVVSVEGVQPKLTLSKTSINFGGKVVIRSNQVKLPYSMELYMKHSSMEEGQPVAVKFGKPFSAKDPAVDTIFSVVPSDMVVEAGEMVGVSLHFVPRDAQSYEATIPLYVDGDMSTPYFALEVQGSGEFPRLSFSSRECVLPPVPLGFTSRGTFKIVNQGYDNLELRYRLPADEGHVPMKIEFPEGNLIGLAKQELPVVVTFSSPKPLSFTATIDFLDEEGKRYSMPVTATADNCLFTHQSFLKANADRLEVTCDEGYPVTLDVRGEVLLPRASDALGPLVSTANIGRFLEATSSRGGGLEANISGQMVASKGRLAIDIVELLSGKSIPKKVAKFSNNKTEAAEQLLGVLDSLLVFLKAHGALLNAVKPEMLLDLESFEKIMTARTHKVKTAEESASLGLWDDVELNFNTISAQAWNMVILQAFKIFVLGRVSLKTFKIMPGIDRIASSLPPDSAIAGSNMYSVPESVLLAWMTAHYMREFGDKGFRVTNFDSDLTTGLVLFSLLSGYWPTLSARRGSLRHSIKSERDKLENNEAVVRFMGDLGLPFEVKPEDLCKPEPKEMLVLVLYLYQTLPQFVPKTTIEFPCKLGESVTKDLELSNPSKKAISYTAKLEGHKDFTTQVSVIRIEAKGTARLQIKCIPTTSVPVQSRLILMSRRDGGAHAATLVFQLVSKVDTRAPLKRVRVEGPLYELQQFEINVSNPFPSEVDLTSTLLHEPAEPPPPKEPVPEKKGRSSKDKKASPAAELEAAERPKQAPQVYPNSLGIDRPRFRLKPGGSEKLRGYFLPFTMGTHYLTLVFKDRELGEFTYEIVAEATLPAPLMESKGTVPLEGPYVFSLSVPWVNSNLEVAKKTFMERHPLAKDKLQAAFLREVPKIGELDYTISQTNTLITCPKAITLSASGVGKEVKEEAGSPIKSTSQANLATPSLSTQNVIAPEKSSMSVLDLNTIPLTLKPIGPGIYPTRLLLTSNLDVRVMDVELMSQTMTQSFQLDFACPVRHVISQDIPLVNTSDQVMNVKATIEGGPWSGNKDVQVAAGATIMYPLTFKPFTIGNHKGQLELLIPATGERNVYTLVGKGKEPLAEGHIFFETQARKTASRSFSVPNIVGAPVEYTVMCDLDMVSGPQTLKCAPNMATPYKLLAAPQRSGNFMGSISFRSPEGHLVWYALEIRASEPDPVDTIRLMTQMGEAVAIKVPMKNPLSAPVQMTVQYSHPDVLLGSSTVTLPVSAKPYQIEFYFAPVKPGLVDGHVSFTNDEMGEFKYRLLLTAEPQGPVIIPELTSELGGRPCLTHIKIDNPLSRQATFTLKSSNELSFKPKPQMVTIPALGFAEFSVEYTPCSLSLLESAVVTLEEVSGDVGRREYHMTGRGLPPAPAELTTLLASLGPTPPSRGAPGMVTWKNPFPTAVTAEISLSNPAPEIELGLDHAFRAQLVQPFALVQIPLSFRPTSFKTLVTDVLVNVSRPPGLPQPLTWRLPVRGIPEAKQTTGASFKFKCKSRSKTEQTMEIVLVGLAGVGPEDEFVHELSIPADVRQHVDNKVLKVEAVHTRISSPDQPLQYNVTFAPMTVFSESIEFLVNKSSGGRWRFELQLQAEEPELDGTIIIEAGVEQTAYIPLYLYSKGGMESYAASFTSETPLDFNISPDKGELRARPDNMPSQFLFGQQSTSSPDDSAPIWLSYTCHDFGKVAKGRLFVQTEDAHFTFDIRGQVYAYKPPSPEKIRSTVDHKLSPELAQRLNMKSGRDHISRNLKSTKGRH
ncbi:hypothetical protein CEUSTIGMA_g2317.t1 [Chlamydomonas eustigma]|uniref:Calponin-homology (CH) domain-containing protein n=1 Tax=Chlamydomonas eustigma TaxID=1157962 RepID=A0A250WVM3_9CHLO|nr:hypothetical protein CEUSTIGMA_g2317.t1 [Chlamydomonas eustigma]|eukprot:GAX74871.1 hypothetical protein CEUSTIGMA_g2317.t1 [Chlamydomonas eustigma]